MTISDLNACYFCGSKNVKVSEFDKPQPLRYAVECKDCLACGSFAMDRFRAVKAWNKAISRMREAIDNARQRPMRVKSPGEVSGRLATHIYVINRIIEGLHGRPFNWGAGEREAYTKIAAAVGITLVTKTAAARRGYSLKRGARPVGCGYWGAPLKKHADLYILECQCRYVREQL